MSRTKAKARRGPEGHAFRENQKRKQKEQSAAQSSTRATKRKRGGKSEASSAKKAKRDKPSAGPEGGDQSALSVEDTVLAPVSSTSKDLSANTPPILEGLAATHDVTTMSIISSTPIQKKVTQALKLLSVYPVVPPAKPTVVMLHAKAKAASKMITVAEIVKREVAKEGGKWYQYNKVDPVMEEKKERPKKSQDDGKREKEATDGVGESMADGEEEEAAESEGEAFEIMKTPFERAIEGQPQVRAVPVMTLYLSRARIDSLRKAYGEQTNGLESTKK